MRNIASLLILLAGFTRNCCLAATPNPSTSPNITISNSSSDEEISRLIDTGLTRKDFKAIQAISSQVSSVFAGTDPTNHHNTNTPRQLQPRRLQKSATTRHSSSNCGSPNACDLIPRARGALTKLSAQNTWAIGSTCSSASRHMPRFRRKLYHL